MENTWTGAMGRHETRPVQNSRPTPEQVARTVVAEMKSPGYMVSFFDGDDINTGEALLILAKAVLDKNRN